MIRTLLILTVLAVLPHSVANAEFVVDELGALTPDFFVGNTISTSDDFGNLYTINRTVVGANQVGPATQGFTDTVRTFEISYDFTPSPDQSPSSTFALGFYAQNFRIEGVNSDPDNAFDLSVEIVRGNGLSESLSLGAVNNFADPIFFDFTDFANVGILNDLSELNLTFTALNPGFTNINFDGFRLVATPEPTSAASFGLLGLIGLVGSTRRRRK